VVTDRARQRRKAGYFARLGYIPRSAQRAAHDAADSHRFVGFFAYPRAGKSLFAAREVGATYWMQGTARHPGHRCWIVAPTYDLGSKEFGYIWQDHATIGVLPQATIARFDIRSGAMEIVYPWGWTLRVRTVENPLTLLAEELDDLILAEGSQLPESAWDRYLSARTKVRQGRVFIPTTPKGKNWLYHRFYLPAWPVVDGHPNPRHDTAYWARIVSHLEGIGDLHQPGVYSGGEIDRARREMAAGVFREQFGGDFVSYAGLVFGGVSRQRTGCDPFPIPADWDLLCAIDPGTSPDPTAILFGAWDHQTPRHLWLWGLIYERDKPVAYYVDRIRAMLEFRPTIAFVSDPSEKQVRLELSMLGYPTCLPHSRAFQDGWNAVQSLIETDRLHVFHTLDHWWNEVERYEWRETAKGETRTGLNKATVQATDARGPDHAMAAMRYLCLHPVPQLTVVEPAQAFAAVADPADRRVWQSWERRRQELVTDADADTGVELADALRDDELEAIYS